MTTPRSKPLTPSASSKSNVPVLGRQGTKKVATTSVKKATGKPNQSILSFFKKVDGPVVGEESIFVGQEETSPTRGVSGGDVYGGDENEGSRYNEDGVANKRRKLEIEDSQARMFLDAEEMESGKGAVVEQVAFPSKQADKVGKKKPRKLGPFIEDSDEEELSDPPSEDDVGASELGAFPQVQSNDVRKSIETRQSPQNPITPPLELGEAVQFNPRIKVPVGRAQAKWEALQSKSRTPSVGSGQSTPGIEERKEAPVLVEQNNHTAVVTQFPELKKESNSMDGWGGFDDLEGFPDEFAIDGEEFMERKWMEEQAMLEGADDPEEGLGGVIKSEHNEEITGACPICNASLDGITPDDATRHVNGCLDGKPIPLPKSEAKAIKPEPSEPQLMPEGASKRFARRAAQPRPGQANPFELGRTEGPSSAFSKLMSGHAEDAAWATAAAAEHAARGKPAYQRTCPFYKIMPGFFICVDAFRFGAVQGCNAYFLSHFHSDHYVGLTSTWCHGPIYCSKVTANLVKQQLRVDPKYVIPLDFESKIEVPGTEGVSVTMIPANHCPGSSLYLFEKTIGRGRNPRVQRVLHCGDFRACPAHVEHPLLMPDIVDSVSGKTKQQKIDVCYLDTTYLNSRYAFPSQEDVITACADMCISLRKERAEESDAWEVAKKERAGTGMNRYVSTTIIKSEDAPESEIKPKARGRLLIICGTYSIGKERICMGIARALDCKIYAPPQKMRICAALEDPELMSRMTPHPLEAQIHMQALMEIRPETLGPYLDSYRPHFSRIVAFRPSGWNYKPPIGRGIEAPSVETILKGKSWRSSFGFADLQPQRGSTREVMCFGVPYSEHSSFRELSMFVCALRIEKVVPTVNVGSARGRAAMRGWVDRWMAERRKAVGGVVRIGMGEGDVWW